MNKRPVLLLVLSMALSLFGGGTALATEELAQPAAAAEIAAAEDVSVPAEWPEEEAHADAALQTDGDAAYVYELTTVLEAGRKYLLVSSGAAGAAYALGHDEDAVASDAVMIRSEGDSLTIRAEDVDDTSVFTAVKGSGQSSSGKFSFSNGGWYIIYNSVSGAIEMSQSGYSWTCEQKGEAYKLKNGGNYLAYSGGAWVLSGSRTGTGVYLFGQVDTAAPQIKLDRSVLVLHRQTEPTGVLKATVSNAPGATVSFTSADSSVASVSSDGTVTAASFGTTTVTAAITVNGTSYSASCEVTVTGYSTSGYHTDSTYLAFGTDRHGVENAIAAAMTGMPQAVSYVGLIGDMVTDGSCKVSTICSEVYSFFDNSDIGVNITYGDHDSGLTADVNGVLQGKNGYGVVYTGYKNDKVLYYVYGVSMNYMSSESAAATAAAAFKAWVDGVDKTIPVFVICHASVDTDRGTSSEGGYIWTQALNYAATGYETTEPGCEITRNVIFLHGHNHTVTKNYNNWKPGSVQKVQSGESEQSVTVYFSVVTAGYMGLTAWGGGSNVTAASMHATLAEITDSEIILTQYPAASASQAATLQTIPRIHPQEPEPEPIPIIKAALILKKLVGLPVSPETLPPDSPSSALDAARILRG